MGYFKRNGPAPYIDKDGNEQTAQIDAPRWTWAPYGPLGLLIESGGVNGAGDGDHVVEDNYNVLRFNYGSIRTTFEWQGEAGPLFQFGDSVCSIQEDGQVRMVFANAELAIGAVNQYQNAHVHVSFSINGAVLAVDGEVVSDNTRPVIEQGPLIVGNAGGEWLNGPVFEQTFLPSPYTASEARQSTDGPVRIMGLPAEQLYEPLQSVTSTKIPSYGD